jgi:KDO2-lipid IV(A) lauroyltransferase
MNRVATLAVRLCVQLYRAYYATLRVLLVLPDSTVVTASGAEVGPDIFALCECDTLALGGSVARRGVCTIVAPGRDGDIASIALGALGCRVVRGSTRSGAVAALVGLLQHAQAGMSPTAIVVDGPLGPPGVAKPGAIVCGMRSGRPVRALGVAATRRLVFPRTWSGIYLPLPFSTVVVTIDRPLNVDRTLQSAAADLTMRLRAAHDQAAATLALRTRRLKRLRTALMAAHVTVRDALLAFAMVLIGLPVWLLPWPLGVRLGRAYGYVLWAVSVRSRRIGLINLRRAFGDALPNRDLRRTIRAVFGHLGESVAEGLQFARRGGDQLPPFECEDPDLEQRILGDPRAKVFVTAHLGAWELAPAIAAARAGSAGAVIFRRVDNPFIDALWRRVRPHPDAEWIEKRGAAGRAAAALRAGYHVAMLVDENGGYRGLFVPFFGRPASTRKTAAVLSLSTGAPVVLGACVRRPGRPYLFRLAMFEPPLDMAPRDALRELTASVVEVIELWIRDDPAQWRWVHARWKTRPDRSEERYGRAELREALRKARVRPGGCHAQTTPGRPAGIE